MKKYITIDYRYKKFNNKYFLTSDTSRFCVLTEKEWNLFKHSCFTNESLEKLKSSHILLDEENFQEAIDIKNMRFNDIMEGTSLHIIVVTLRCNMHCLYCQVGRKYCDDKKYDMTIETAIKTVDIILQSPNKKITIEFQGGEPTINFNVLKFIIEYSKKMNKDKEIIYSLVTNMTTMNDEIMNYLIDNNVDVCTSLDGDEHIHNHNRRYDKNNHQQVLFWIKKFNDEYKKRNINKSMSALVTLTKESLKYYKEIIDTYVNIGIEVVHLRKLTKLGFAKQSWEKIGYTVEEYLEFWEKAVEYIEQLKKEGKFINERMVLMIEQKIYDDKDVNYMDLRSPCGACIGQIAYNYDGDIYSCDEARMMKLDRFKVGNVFKSKYDDLIKYDECFALVFDSTNTQFDCCNECVYQNHCGVCPVLNYANYGKTVVNPDETDMCKIMKKQFDWVINRFFIV